MLHLYDLNKNKIEGLTKYKDYCIESTLSTGDKVLSFVYPSKFAKGIKEECYIRTKAHQFVVKEVNDHGDWTSIKAVLDVEELEGKEWEHFSTVEQTIENCFNLALAGTGWTVQVNGVTKKRTIRKTNCSTWDIIQQAKKTYLVEIEFDSINKIVKVYEKIGTDKGVYFMDSLNLCSLEVQSNSYDFYTRMIAKGKDDLKVTVENYKYSSKKKTLIWKDERYTVLESLKEDATAKLEELSKPRRAYSANIIDLANMSDRYSILAYGLGDIVTLISKDKGIKEKQRIVKIVYYPEEPERNTAEIANTILRFEDIQKEFQDTADTVSNITEDNGTISEGAIRTAVEHITINKADIQSFNAAVARIGTLEATKADITELNAQVARIDNLQANKANIVDLTATNAKINTLEGKAASIETILSKEVFVELASAGKIVAGSSIIAEGAIGSAQISSLNAGKITSGTVDTSKVTIQGANGRLKITGNRLQVFAGTTNLYERVSLGDVNGDGSIYGLRVRGADGVTVLLDENGVKSEGITNGSITNSKVAENANISGSKLDIASVVTSINNGTTTIQGSKIYVDGKTLDLSFSTLKSTVTSQGASISSQSIQITALDSAIKLKVDQQTFNNLKATTEGNISTINTSLSKATSDINVLQGQIKLKVEQSNIDTSIKNVTIGGRNLFKGYDEGEIRLNNYRNVGGFTQFFNSFTFNPADYINEEFTISFYAKSPNGVTGLRLYNSNGDPRYFYFNAILDNALGEDWKYYSFTFKNLDRGSSYTPSNKIEIYAQDKMGVLVKKIKIEKGTKATDWTPAPEDVDQAISTINNKIETKAAEIKVTTDGITNRVASTESSITTINGEVSTLKTRVSTAEQKITDSAIISTVRTSTAYQGDLNTKANQSALNSTNSRLITAESSITQMAGQIATKVDVNGVKSTIEQNPTSVKTGFNGINDIVEITEYGTIFKHPTIGTKTKIDSKGFGIYEINDKDFENPLGSFWGSGNAGFENVISTEVKANKVYAENIESIQEESVTYYVRPGFGDNTFEGTMFDAPFDSVNYALSKINKIIPRGISVTIMVYGDIYESIVVEGFRGGGTLTINFDATSKVYSQIVAANVDLHYLYIHGGRTSYNVNNGCMIETTDEHGFEFLKVANYELKGFRGNCIFSSGADKYKYMLHAVASRGSVRWLDSYGYYGQIYSEQCSITRVHDNRGRGSRGYLAYYGSIILGGHDGAGTCMPIGTNTIYEGGIIDIKGKTEAADCLWNPTNTPSPTPTKKIYTKSWSATSTQSWRDSYGWRSDNRYIYQGAYGYGNHRGFICFNDGDIRTQLSGATIKSARLYLKRRSAGGSSASQRATMYLHGYSSTGGGYSLGTLIGSTVGYAWGTGAWSSIPVSAIKSLQNGTARGIALYASGGSPYIIFEATATLEITYEK